MKQIKLKSANLSTSIPREKIRAAVREAFEYYGIFKKKKKNEIQNFKA